jgi:hypothetical protein
MLKSNSMPHAIRIISQLNQQRMTEDLRAGYRRALLQVPGARDFQFYDSTITRVTFELITTQRLTMPDIAITLAVIGIFNDPKMPEIRS